VIQDCAHYFLCGAANNTQTLRIRIGKSEVQENAWQRWHENKISDAGFSRLQPNDYQAMFRAVGANPNCPSQPSAWGGERSRDRYVETTVASNLKQRTNIAPYQTGVHKGLPQLPRHDNLQLRKFPATF
jgi:hypothetical protein